MPISIKHIKTRAELAQAFDIRRQVFCVEQKVSEEIEMDKFDEIATHILAYIDGKPIGTARWRFTSEGAKLERFAVLKEYRGKSVGDALVNFVLNEIKDAKHIYLCAQESVINFYEKFGFEIVGDRFYEANIPHKRMNWKRREAC